MKPIDEFWSLCEKAYEIDLTTDNSLDYEKHMIEIIELVQSHPELRTEWIDCFKKAINDFEADIPLELIPFCMRSLRFNEIRDHVVALRQEHQNDARQIRDGDYWNNIMHAFDDSVWEDADFWPYYHHELQKK